MEEELKTVEKSLSTLWLLIWSRGSSTDIRVAIFNQLTFLDTALIEGKLDTLHLKSLCEALISIKVNWMPGFDKLKLFINGMNAYHLFKAGMRVHRDFPSFDAKTFGQVFDKEFKNDPEIRKMLNLL